MVLVHDTSSRRGLLVYQVSLKNLKRFSSYRADTICDGQTDRQTDGRTDGRTDARGKTICLPTLSGGDIITKFSLLAFCQKLFFVIRAVGGQRSSPDLCYATTSVKIYDP